MENINLIQTFRNYGYQYLKHSEKLSTETGYRRFRGLFGVSPSTCAVLWTLIENKPQGSKPKHLLWSLLFLKCYANEHMNSALVGVDEKTFRKWNWIFIQLLADLNVVNWNDRHRNANYPQRNVFVSLDGTDFPINEPTPFDKKWFSHKFHGPGVRYEIGLAIGTGYIVWASGGLPCGEWPDIKMAKDAYIYFAENEMTLADKGYNDTNYFKPSSTHFDGTIMARHETVNRRLKQFNVLKNQYRHHLRKHPKCFHACVNVVQIQIEDGESLFEV